jgi:RES domain-containing protein
MLRGYKRVWMDVPDALVTGFDVDRLPEDWQAVPAQASTREIGDKWFDSRASVVLRVPSTVIPEEYNFVLNPSHPEYNKLLVGEFRDFVFDTRLFYWGK